MPITGDFKQDQVWVCAHLENGKSVMLKDEGAPLKKIVADTYNGIKISSAFYYFIDPQGRYIRGHNVTTGK